VPANFDLCFASGTSNLLCHFSLHLCYKNIFPGIRGWLVRRCSGDGQNSRAVNGVIRRTTDAITNLAHENSSIKTRVMVNFRFG